MTYAVIRFGGKQFKVEKGETIKLERQEEASVEVLLYAEDEEIIIGEPVLSDCHVTLEKIEDSRAKKIRVGRFKSKSRYRKIKGHRQPISTFKVEDIYKGKVKPAKETKEVKEDVKEEKVPKAEKVEKAEKVGKTSKKETVKSKDKAVKEVVKKGRPAKEKSSEKTPAKKRGRPKKEDKK